MLKKEPLNGESDESTNTSSLQINVTNHFAGTHSMGFVLQAPSKTSDVNSFFLLVFRRLLSLLTSLPWQLLLLLLTKIESDAKTMAKEI